MIQSILKIFLFPISIVYGFILYIRNKLYDWEIFKSTTFKTPTISVGNLSLGGTGKTPHIEYLIRLLKNENNIATISRGYKRKTTGFILANHNSTANDIGDEPLQFKTKFNNIIVTVAEKRVSGIQQIKVLKPTTDIILLDDAYQHRSVNPTINILLSEYNNLYSTDFVLPLGRLREFRCGSNRADIIIISKSPKNITIKEREAIVKSLKPKSYQSVFFTSINYGKISAFTKAAHSFTIKPTKVILLTGIAKPTPLIKEVEKSYQIIKHLKYPDHHSFSKSDISDILSEYKQHQKNNIIIISTEKDIMRLSLSAILIELDKIPIFYIPIEIEFNANDKKEFDKNILNNVKTNTRN